MFKKTKKKAGHKKSRTSIPVIMTGLGDSKTQIRKTISEPDSLVSPAIGKHDDEITRLDNTCHALMVWLQFATNIGCNIVVRKTITKLAIWM